MEGEELFPLPSVNVLENVLETCIDFDALCVKCSTRFSIIYEATTKSKTHDSCSPLQMYGLDPFIPIKIHEKWQSEEVKGTNKMDWCKQIGWFEYRWCIKS